MIGTSENSIISSLVMQANFNAGFEAAKKSRQTEVDKILDANNRMKEIWEEQARMGAVSGGGEGSLFKPQGGLDDTEDSVLSVKVLHKLLPSCDGNGATQMQNLLVLISSFDI